jgi:outer membrane protein assembly factor BamA
VDCIDAETRGFPLRGSRRTWCRPGDVTYVRTGALAEVDWRESPGYSTSGGLYRLDWSSYLAQRNAPHSFTRVDALATQLIPILRANWVIALRAMASVTNTAEGETVPAFLLPSLGGGESLRGYSPWRFRDRHRLLFSGEYRWTAGQFVDMALFVDAGKVATRKEDLNLSDLNRSFGIGVRFHAPGKTFLRVELARTRDDGYGIIFSVGPPF